MRAPVVAVVVAALAVGLGAVAPAQASGTTPAAPAYTPPPITWSDCSAEWGVAGMQCGALVVPVDYGNPAGTKAKLAVTRIRHTSSAADYQGVMIGNPGGPGVSGTFVPVLADAVPGTSSHTYDWVGFDPRGVGQSTPTLRCNRDYFHVNRLPYVPWSDALMTAWRARAARYAKACSTAGAKTLLGHLRTTDTVQDLESLRVALGQQQISYYGFSYGTYLGQVYATQHPDRVHRFVLDGNVDPGRVWYAANLDQDVAFGDSMTAFWQWVSRHAKGFGLSSDWRNVRRGYFYEVNRLRTHPWHDRLGASELNDAVLGAGYYVYDWVDIATALGSLRRTGNGGPMLSLYQQTPDYGDDNSYAVYNATSCTDAPWPAAWRTWVDDSWNTYQQRAFLTWNNTWYNAPCFTWPATAGTPVNVSGAHVTEPILLVNETLDAATPFSGALEVRRRFPTASLVAGVGGTTHAASLSGVPCVDDAIAAYLTDGTVPDRVSGDTYDRGCPPVPAPGEETAKRPLHKALPMKWRQRLMR